MKRYEANGTKPAEFIDLELSNVNLPKVEINYTIDRVAYYTIYIELSDRHIPGSPFNMYVGPNKQELAEEQAKEEAARKALEEELAKAEADRLAEIERENKYRRAQLEEQLRREHELLQA